LIILFKKTATNSQQLYKKSNLISFSELQILKQKAELSWPRLFPELSELS
jgi:hypothetical protein